MTDEVTRLYNENFGIPGTQSYGIASVEVPSSSIRGESKGNAIYFAYRSNDDHNLDEPAGLDFMQLIENWHYA